MALCFVNVDSVFGDIETLTATYVVTPNLSLQSSLCPQKSETWSGDISILIAVDKGR